MTIFKYAALAAIALASISSAQATTVLVSETLDLSYVHLMSNGFIGAQGTPAFSTDQNFALVAGDVLDHTITFLPTQTLTLNGATDAWALIYADTQTDVNGTGTFSFLDSIGTAILTSNVKTDSEGAVHFGQFFYDADFTGGFPPSITFSGVRYVGTLNYYVDPTVTTRNYNVPGLFFQAASFSATGVPAVPEPATWAMMIAGFGIVGAALRLRKASTRVSYSA